MTQINDGIGSSSEVAGGGLTVGTASTQILQTKAFKFLVVAAVCWIIQHLATATGWNIPGVDPSQISNGLDVVIGLLVANLGTRLAGHSPVHVLTPVVSGQLPVVSGQGGVVSGQLPVVSGDESTPSTDAGPIGRVGGGTATLGALLLIPTLLLGVGLLGNCHGCAKTETNRVAQAIVLTTVHAQVATDLVRGGTIKAGSKEAGTMLTLLKAEAAAEDGYYAAIESGDSATLAAAKAALLAASAAVEAELKKYPSPSTPAGTPAALPATTQPTTIPNA